MALGAQQQAIRYHARLRRRGLLDPSSRLYRTHVFTVADADIDTEAAFGDQRTKPVVFAFLLTGDGAASGLVFEFGSENRGVAVWVDGADMGVCAGAGVVESEDDGVTLQIEDALPLGLHRFALSVEPGAGRISLYRNGRLIGSAQSANGDFDGAWADDDHGAVGDASDTVLDRVPVESQAALDGAALVGPLSVYAGQRVRI